MKGKIYKLVDVGYNKCYIGSTIENLSDRIARHRYSYKMWCSGKRTTKNTAFDMLDEFGVDNIKMEEIEKYPVKIIRIRGNRGILHSKKWMCK